MLTEDPSPLERLQRAHEAELAEKKAARRAWMTADIEAHLASIENRNELVRVNEEANARQAAAREAQKVRAQIERVMVEKRRRAAAELELQQAESRFDVDAWRNDPALPEGYQPQALTVKEELRQHYLALLLPAVVERAPVWWKVLSVLHEKSPADLSFFELPTWQLAKQAGVAKESVRTAVTYLLEKKLIAVKHGVWDKNPNRSVHPRYRLERANG